MDYQEIRDVLFEHFKAMRERTKQRIATHGRLAQPEKTALINNSTLAAQALATSDYSLVGTDDELGQIIGDYELPVKQGSNDYGILRTEFLAAFRDYCSSVIEYDNRFEGYNFKTDPVSLAMQKATKRTSRKKLADVLEIYIAEKLRLKQWRENVAMEFRPQFNLLLRYLGADTPLNISDDVAKDVKNMLLRLPKHINKKKEFTNLTIKEIIALDNKELISAPTVSKHISSYSSFYDWAVKRKEASENPFSALVDDTTKASKERDSFTIEQSRLIIDKAINAKKPHHKWGALIAFYTGARLNEIAQLDAEDIVLTDDIWCISINDNNQFKRLKNKASKRIVPIHSRLIELGLLEFVKGKKGHLFKELSYNKSDGYGRNIGRWFNESLLPELGIKTDSLVFHSIRHTVAEKLRNNSVELSTIKDLLGHIHGDVTIDVYANNLNKALMQKAINTLSYG